MATLSLNKNKNNNVVKKSKRNFFKEFYKELKKNKILFLMLLPATAFFISFNYLPMSGLVLAFKKFNYVDGIFGSPWVGLENFRFLFKSGTLWKITKNTLSLNTMFYIVGTFFEISIAIFLSELANKHFKKVTQSILFLPYFISFVLLGAFVYNIFNYEFGSLNTLLRTLGMQPIDVYSKPGIWRYILTGFSTWKWMGHGSIIYLAVIMGFDRSIYEAAEIDGASMFQKIFRITIPMLKTTIIILSLMFVSRILKGQFQLFYNIIGDNAQLFDATDVIDTYVFRALTRQFNIGIGSAVSFYQSTFGLALLLSINWIIKKFDKESALF